jgi:hypothetical protein
MKKPGSEPGFQVIQFFGVRHAARDWQDRDPVPSD